MALNCSYEWAERVRILAIRRSPKKKLPVSWLKEKTDVSVTGVRESWIRFARILWDREDIEMTNRWGVLPILLFGLAVSLPAENAQASLFSLDVFTDNGNFADGSQVNLFVDVTEDSGRARFEFHNHSSVSSSIAEIYFDDAGDLLAGPPDIDNGPGVSFSLQGSPGHLPAGNDLSLVFITPPDFMASADNPAPTNGINPSTSPDPDEWAALIFDFEGGSTISDVLDDLQDGTLRIGLHLIALPDDSSEAAVTPEPATLGLILLGSLMLLRRRHHSDTSCLS